MIYSLHFFILLIIIATSLLYVGACSSKVTDSNDIEFEVIEINGWSENTHRSSADPDYDEVFCKKEDLFETI